MTKTRIPGVAVAGWRRRRAAGGMALAGGGSAAPAGRPGRTWLENAAILGIVMILGS